MKKRSGLRVMLRLIGLVKPLTGFMLLAIMMGLVGHLTASFITIFGGYAVAEVLGIETPFTIVVLFVSVIIFAIMRGILRYAEQACNHFIAFKLLALIRDKVFRALRRLCPAKLDGKDKGNLISVITADIELLEVFYAHTISPIAIATLFSGILCIFIGSYHWSLGVIAFLAYTVVGGIIPMLISKLSGEDGIKFRSKSGELSSFVLDSLRGLYETLQYGQGMVRLQEINRKTDELSAEEKRMKETAGRNKALTNTVILIFDLVMLFASAMLYQNGTIEFLGVLIPTIAMMSSFGPVIALADLGSTLQHTFAAGNRVLDILDETPVTEEVSGKENVDFDGVIAANVSFSYCEEIGNENILDNVSVEIPKGSVIGIVGKSGSGKSTLLKLFMRFWNSQKGEVKISDVNVNEINTHNLRNMESFVTQETHLFHDSIRNNLRIAKFDATDEEIETACKKASVHDFILSLPKGYDTPVGELGDTLSGGERQRIGLARAFLHNAPFMLLDEPTSNLDSLNEAIILKSLQEERENKTVVLVSHRQSTMRIVDKVYSVEHGRVS
ncbi:MAG: ABC transporter ATP-binding protein [Tyzzerella sp.]|nr:ABC transporter ATP-binding protein [Tyzzerella sp.]